jgi:enoyl-CoA hydratase/carnithine racemase
MPTAQPNMPCAVIADWPALQNTVSRHPIPENWWLTQDRSCLVIEARGNAPPAAPGEADDLRHWLRNLPAPVIALAPDEECSALLSVCDARTSRPEEAALIARNCASSPLAALALVQVLRIAEGQSFEHGLMTESFAYATLQAGPEFMRWLDAYARPAAALDEGPAIRIDRKLDAVSIRLNRPQARNALDIAMRDALVEAFDLVSSDAAISTATVSAAGRCFSVGGELSEFGARPDPASAHRIRSLRNPALSLLRCGQRVEFRVHGACIGSGMELPAFGRRIIARSDAYFQLPELRMGLIPGSGGCVSLPKKIGRQRTALLALTGRRLRAREALAWGLVDEMAD